MPDPLISAAQLHAFAPAAPASLAPYLSAAAVLNGITTPIRLAHFLAQVAHESAGMTRREENLSYSAERLVAVWPSRFASIAIAMPYARNPQALANLVYGSRMGNAMPGDGYLYRGRGLIQITGRGTYRSVGALCGIDLERHPEMALTDDGAAESAGGFWTWKALNPLADADNLQAITNKINGGLNGLNDRAAWLSKARAIWCA